MERIERRQRAHSWHLSAIRALRMAALALSIALPGMGGARGQEVVIGAAMEPMLDPHFQFLTSNISYWSHIYEPLIRRDNEMRLQPALAVRWERSGDHAWVFSLRQGVTFHDGTPFTADDVIFSLRRIATLENNPAPYSGLLKTIASIDRIDDHTIRVTTTVPNPLLPAQFPGMAILSRRSAEGMRTPDFASGRAVNGTGPYRLDRYARSQELVLNRSSTYWGPAPNWEKVTFRIIPNRAARVAALLARDVSMIDFVPPADVPQLRSRGMLVHTGPSVRMIYLMPDVGREVSPFVTGVDGTALPSNPLRDARVRRAISLAIDRKAIVERVMGGFALESNQVVAPGMIGFAPDRPAIPFDPAAARRLLAEAGYPQGFGLTIHCPNGRYVNDAQLCQALGQMLARIGIQMNVVTQPVSVFFTNVRAPMMDYSLALMGWGTQGEATSVWMMLHSYDRSSDVGTVNRGGYSNPEVDRLVQRVITTFDTEERAALERQAMAIVMDEAGYIPLLAQTVISATLPGLDYAVNMDEHTLANNLSRRP